MKKLLVATIMVLAFFTQGANAQIKLGVNINIGSQPEWGPTGYDYVDNYYLPDIDAYYNVPAKQFTYMEGNRWVTRASLPARYSNYDLYHGYKVVANERNPWNRASYYRSNYGKYKNVKGRQTAIRDSKEDKYRRGRGHDDRRDPRGRH